MRVLIGLWFFYKKFVLPALILSAILAFFAPEEIKPRFTAGMAFSFLFFAPAFHYFMYEINSPQEYYFYHNLGLSRLTLWLTTLLGSWLIALSIFLL